MTVSIGLALAALIGPLVAALAHEITHAAAARLLGGRVVSVDLRQQHVDFAFDTEAPVRRRVVLLAPALVGVASVPVLLSVWDGTVGPDTFVGALCWSIYALNGGSDGEIQLRIPERLRHLPEYSTTYLLEASRRMRRFLGLATVVSHESHQQTKQVEDRK